MTRFRALAAVGLFVVAGCAGLDPDVAIPGAVVKGQQINDAAGQAYKVAPCLIRTGAFFRMTPREQCGIALLCGGNCDLFPQSQPSFLVSPIAPVQ